LIHSINNYQLPNKILGLTANTIRTACLDNKVGEIVYNGINFEGFNGDSKFFGLQRNSDPKAMLNKVQKRMEIDYSTMPVFRKPRIAILLESPHINEYSPNNKTGISGPAMGSSGNRFNGQCISVFNNNIGVLQAALGINTGSSQRYVYEVFFVNAIQYQCSLGYSPIKKEIRDFVFEALWNSYPNSFRDDLVERFNILKPNLIINACTRELQKTVCNNTSISPYLIGFNYSFLTASKHISAWDKNTIIL
jgi:hypothetical protein